MEKPEDQTEYDANEHRRSDWQVKPKILPFNYYVARQSAKSQLDDQGPKKPRADKHHTEYDEQSRG